MMKKTMLSIAIHFASALGVYAQSSLVATLTHNGTTTAYYNAEALVDAHAAAEDGDIITLSSGTFTATNITKAVTIRGAGMMTDNESGTTPTYLQGNFSIGVPADKEGGVVIEGIRNTATVTFTTSMKKAPVFLKSYLGSINMYSTNYSNTDIIISNCVIASSLTLHYNCNQHATIDNSYINRLDTNGKYTVNYGNISASLTNCILNNYNKNLMSVYQNETLQQLTMRNSIIRNVAESDGVKVIPDASQQFFNCVCTESGNTTFFSNMAAAAGNAYATEDIFAMTPDASSISTETMKLTTSAAATYRGSDGTQVGIYGGAAPFSSTPSNPRVGAFHVNTSKVNDKLNVTITVE